MRSWSRGEGGGRGMRGVGGCIDWALEELDGVKRELWSTVVPWLVRRAGSMISRTRRGADGRTAFGLRKGKTYRKRLPPFGEKVMYLAAGKQKSRLLDRWHEGLFLGVQDRSNEVVIGTRDGVVKARAIKRLDGVQRRGVDLLKTMRGLPWELVPGDVDGELVVAMAIERRVLPVRVVADPVVATGDLPPAASGKALMRRSFYVKEKGHREVRRYRGLSRMHGESPWRARRGTRGRVQSSRGTSDC